MAGGIESQGLNLFRSSGFFTSRHLPTEPCPQPLFCLFLVASFPPSLLQILLLFLDAVNTLFSDLLVYFLGFSRCLLFLLLYRFCVTFLSTPVIEGIRSTWFSQG